MSSAAAETICIDGKLLGAAEATISVTDDGLLRGDGVFEMMRLYNGVPFGLEAHMTRLGRSAQTLRLAIDLDAVRSDIELLLGAADRGDATLRVLVTRGGRRISIIEPLPEIPASVALGFVTYAPVRVLDQVKSLSYAGNMQATRLARERGYDDALLVTPHGRVLELPTATLFWARDGELRTPPLTDHVLDSITRRLVLELTDARQEETSVEALAGADEAFVASSVREIMAIHRIEETELAPAGPLTLEVAQDLRERIAAEL